VTSAKTCGDGPTACPIDQQTDADSWDDAIVVEGCSWWASRGDTAWPSVSAVLG